MAKSKGKVLVIASSDPKGGAGMQADLATLKDFNVPTAFAVTAITAQGENEALSIHPTPVDILTQQLSAASADQDIGAIKIGVVSTSANVRALVWFLHREKSIPIVIDPVLHSSSGASLLETKGIPVFRQQLLPLATVITPNLLEASAMVGMQVASLDQMHEAAGKIYKELIMLRGVGGEKKPLAIVIKGGHLRGDAVDLVYDGKEFVELRENRIPGRSPRGAGCRFASAIAAGLAQKKSVMDSVEAAKRYMTTFIMKNSK